MSAQVQQLVDDLAEKLQRSVAVDDPDIQLIAASPQVGTIDPTRMDTILSRKTKPEIIAFVRSLRPERVRAPRRIAGVPEREILPRVLFPLRHHDELYGYLWLIDVPEVSVTEVALVEEATEAIARLLADETRAADLQSAEDARLMADLLSEDVERQREGAARAERTGRLRRGAPWRVAVIRLATDGPEGADRSGLAHASHVFRGVLGQTLSGAVEDEFVIVSDDPSWDPPRPDARPAVRPVWERLQTALASRGLSAGVVGVSPRLGEEPLRFARSRAHYCTHIANRVPALDGLAQWEHLGAWQLLYGLPWTEQTVRQLYPGIEVLLRPENRELAVTLATYLDRGGDSNATVEALRVHRATLYYRRDRIRALIGVEWEAGWSRVGAHAALVLAGMLDPRWAAVP